MMIMKRLVSLFTIGFVASILVGCSGPTVTDKAAEWLLANANYVICADEEHPLLYYFEIDEFEADLDVDYISPIVITKVDLTTGESKPLDIYVPGWDSSESLVDYFLLPEDKGWNNPEPKFVFCIDDTAFLYNAKTEQFSTICEGDLLYVCGKHIVCCNDGDSYYSTGFSDISAYDANGVRLAEYRTFVGTIAKQEVVVDLYISDEGYVFGSYYYAKYAKNGKAERMLLDGYIEAGSRIVLSGFNNDGDNTETWTGTLVGGQINAQFVNLYNLRAYDFSLVEKK